MTMRTPLKTVGSTIKAIIRSLRFTAPIVGLLCCAENNLHAATTAVRANDFLNTIGVCTHMSQGADIEANVATCLTYAGIRNVRDDGSTSSSSLANFTNLHVATGAKVSLLPINGNVASSLSEWETLAAAGALLDAEGPNEPNNA